MEQLNCLRCAYRHEDNGNCMAVGGFCTAVPAAHCRLLQEYLGTGLMPEEVNDVVVGPKPLVKAKLVSAFGVAAERLRELAEADKAGRLVVLPCKVGGEVYSTLDDFGQIHQCRATYVHLDELPYLNVAALEPVDYEGSQYGASFGEFGKTVFLTREEAEETLEAMKDG